MTADQREAVQEILRAGDSAAALPRQLLVFSRREVVHPQEIDLNRVVTQSGKMLKRLIGENITCTVASGSQSATVRADPGQIEQILMNLAANARDAMPRGGKLTITTANVELSEAFALTRRDAQPGPYVLLSVSDTGIGMDRATQERMFEPFFTTKAPGQGTGLGLAAVYGIVKQSNGSIEVSSELGHGTTMKIYLPRLTDPVSRDSSHLDDAVPVGSETILLVEDEAPLRRFTALALRSFGYRVLEAESGDRALELSRTHSGSIHLLLSDLVMPGLSGREVAERLLVERPGLKVLLVSGYTDDVVIRHGLVAGEVEFLQKPFSRSLLGRRVREVLDAVVRVGVS